MSLKDIMFSYLILFLSEFYRGYAVFGSFYEVLVVSSWVEKCSLLKTATVSSIVPAISLPS